MNHSFDIELYKLHKQYDSHEDIDCPCGMKWYFNFLELEGISLTKATMFVVSRAEDTEYCKNKLRYMIYTLKIQPLLIAKLCIKVTMDDNFPGVLKWKARKVLENLKNL